jgi:Secretion system C-terminal sorting domain
LKIKFFYLPNDSLSEIIYLGQPANDSISKYVHSYGTFNRVDFYDWNAATMGFVSAGFNSFSLDAQFRLINSEYLFQGDFGTFAGKIKNFYGAGLADCLSVEVSSRSNDGVNYEDFKAFYIYNANSATISPQNALDWSIAPNPNNGNFILTIPEESSVTICNSIGQIVWEEIRLEAKSQVNLQHYPAGIYSVILKNGKNTAIKKVMIE